MVDLKKIDRANEVFRTCKFVFNVPGQIASIEKLKASKRQKHSDAVCIVSFVFVDRFEVVATRFDLRCANLFANHGLVRSNHTKAKSWNRSIAQKLDFI